MALAQAMRQGGVSHARASGDMRRCIQKQVKDTKWQNTAIDRGLKDGHDLRQAHAWDMTRHRDAVDPSRQRDLLAVTDNRCISLIDQMKVGNNKMGIKYTREWEDKGRRVRNGKSERDIVDKGEQYRREGGKDIRESYKEGGIQTRQERSSNKSGEGRWWEKVVQ